MYRLSPDQRARFKATRHTSEVLAQPLSISCEDDCYSQGHERDWISRSYASGSLVYRLIGESKRPRNYRWESCNEMDFAQGFILRRRPGPQTGVGRLLISSLFVLRYAFRAVLSCSYDPCRVSARSPNCHAIALPSDSFLLSTLNTNPNWPHLLGIQADHLAVRQSCCHTSQAFSSWPFLVLIS